MQETIEKIRVRNKGITGHYKNGKDFLFMDIIHRVGLLSDSITNLDLECREGILSNVGYIFINIVLMCDDQPSGLFYAAKKAEEAKMFFDGSNLDRCDLLIYVFQDLGHWSKSGFKVDDRYGRLQSILTFLSHIAYLSDSSIQQCVDGIFAETQENLGK